MARNAAARFAGNVHAPAQARSFATATMGPHSTARQLDDAAMIVSELVTNAVRAGAAVITVDVAIGNDEMRIGVTDDAGGWPTIRTAGEHDTSGRGLPLVAALAQRWGVDLTDPSGKLVWATLQIPQTS